MYLRKGDTSRGKQPRLLVKVLNIYLVERSKDNILVRG